MKKLLLALCLCLLLAPAWAAPASLAEILDTTQISLTANTAQIPLEELLERLSRESGLRLVATPETARQQVSLELAEPRSLAQVLELLESRYPLRFQRHEDTGTIVAVAAEAPDAYCRPNAAPLLAKVALAEGLSQDAYALAPCPPLLPAGAEEYRPYQDNAWQDALSTPLSTFAIDVDSAAYSNLRRFLNRGSLPPADAVRTEEMLNSFSYDYPQPAGEHPFAVFTEAAACPWNPQHQLVMIGLQGRQLPRESLPPSNLVFLIDVSGSMDEEQKLPLLKTAFKLLTKQLRPQDTVAIVTYASEAKVVLKPTAGDRQQTILRAIDSLQAGGSTAGGAGIELAYGLAQKGFLPEGNNRVILATDGDFNVGVSSESELGRLIEERRNGGIFLSVLGFGMGNLKDNKMETLADKGNGQYAYIDNALEAEKVMLRQFAGTVYALAKDVKIQVEFNPAQVKSYRLIGYENRTLGSSDFNNDAKDGGELGAGQAVTALYELVPAASGEAAVVDPLAYQQPQLLPSEDLLQVKVRYQQPQGHRSLLYQTRLDSRDLAAAPSANLRLAAGISEYALLLRQSPWKGQASYAQAAQLIESTLAGDVDGERAELLRLVRLSQWL